MKTMTLLRNAASLLLSSLVLSAVAQTAKPTQLQITTPPHLVDCAPVSAQPCMTAGVTPSDNEGRPAPVTLPSPHDLANAFELHSGSETIKPFFANAGSGPDAAEHTNVVLMVLDISGSMNQPAPGAASRFAALKEAVSRYLDGMQEGSDRIAIVPFESHQVVPTIRAAVFATRKADALAQLNAMPAPGPKNNTAFYQAVFTGVEALQSEVSALERDGHTAAELQPHLIVMTDGKNEVGTSDDASLLNGPLGLQQAVAQVKNAHLDVIGIGFGDKTAIDTDALSSLSTRFFYATDAQQLLEALHVSRSAQSHEVQLTWLLQDANRLALAGRDPAWTPTLHLEGNTNLTGPAIRILTPATAAPVYDRVASPEEERALIAVHPPANSGWSTVVVHTLIFLSAAVVLTLLWFWVPRLVWGERYMSNLPRQQRWASNERGGNTAASGVQIRNTGAPSGFEPAMDSASPMQRTAAQTTQVQPRSEFSRTRLTYESK